MKEYFILKNYFKILLGIIIALFFILIIFSAIICGSEIRDERLMIIVTPAIILILLLLIFIIRIQSLRKKEIMEFLRNESTLKHPISKITREHIIERLVEKGFETYSVDNMQFCLKLVNIKKYIFEMSCCYAFLILDENIDYEKFIKENEELNRITNNYLKGKKMYKFSFISPIVCFWGEYLSDKAIEKCSKGLDLRRREIYIGYETSSENIYYADEIEQIGNLDITYSDNIKAQWIEEIFEISETLESTGVM